MKEIILITNKFNIMNNNCRNLKKEKELKERKSVENKVRSLARDPLERFIRDLI